MESSTCYKYVPTSLLHVDFNKSGTTWLTTCNKPVTTVKIHSVETTVQRAAQRCRNVVLVFSNLCKTRSTKMSPSLKKNICIVWTNKQLLHMFITIINITTVSYYYYYLLTITTVIWTWTRPFTHIYKKLLKKKYLASNTCGIYV